MICCDFLLKLKKVTTCDRSLENPYEVDMPNLALGMSDPDLDLFMTRT